MIRSFPCLRWVVFANLAALAGTVIGLFRGPMDGMRDISKSRLGRIRNTGRR